MRAFLLIIFIFYGTFLVGQDEQPTKKEVFEWAVDLINVQMIKVSIEDFDDGKYLNDFNNIGHFKPIYFCLDSIKLKEIKGFLDEKDLGKTKKLSDEISTIKKLYNDTLENQTVITLLTSDIFNIDSLDLPLLYAFNQDTLHKNKIVNRTDTHIKSVLEDCLAPLNINNNKRAEAVADNEGDDNLGETGWRDEFSKYSFIEKTGFILILLTLLILVIFLICLAVGLEKSSLFFQRFFKLFNSKRKKEKKHFELANAEQIEEIIAKQKEASSEKKIVETPHNQNTNFSNNDPPQDFTGQPESDEKPDILSQVSYDEGIELGVIPKNKSSKPTPPAHFTGATFYLATPRKTDGSFSNEAKKNNFIRGESKYQFQYTNKEETEAKFHICEDLDTMVNSISHPERSIEPVCESRNAHSLNAKRIKTIEKGKAKLNPNTNRWEIIQKAIIRYE